MWEYCCEHNSHIPQLQPLNRHLAGMPVGVYNIYQAGYRIGVLYAIVSPLITGEEQNE